MAWRAVVVDTCDDRDFCCGLAHLNGSGAAKVRRELTAWGDQPQDARQIQPCIPAPKVRPSRGLKKLSAHLNSEGSRPRLLTRVAACAAKQTA
jgi:hypothetical protein